MRLTEIGGDAEISNLDRSIQREHQIRRLDVTMNYLVLLGKLKRLGSIPGGVHGPNNIEPTFSLKQLFKAAALEILHRHIVMVTLVSSIVDLDYIRMIQAAGGAGLLEEALNEILILGEPRSQDLQGDRAVQRKLACQVDCSHGAPAKTLLDFIAGQGASDERILIVGSKGDQGVTDLDCVTGNERVLIYRDIIDPDAVGALVVIDDPFPRLATHHAMNPGGHLVIDTDTVSYTHLTLPTILLV